MIEFAKTTPFERTLLQRIFAPCTLTAESSAWWSPDHRYVIITQAEEVLLGIDPRTFSKGKPDPIRKFSLSCDNKPSWLPSTAEVVAEQLAQALSEENEEEIISTFEMSEIHD